LIGGSENWWLSIAAVTAGLFSVTYSLRFISVFFGKLAPNLPIEQPHEPPHWMRFPVEFLVLLCLLVGIVPAVAIGPMLNNAASSVLGDRTPEYSLAVWHGFNLPLLMSTVALLGGILLYWLLRRYYGLAESDRVPVLHRINGARVYDSGMLRISLLADWLMKRLGTIRLQPQLLLMVAALTAVPLLVGLPLPQSGVTHGAMNWLFAIMWLIGCSCALMAAWQAKYHRLTALILVGGT